MNELANFCKNLKKDFTPKRKNSKEPVKYWSEIDIIEDKPVDAFVIIFRTKGCSWSIKSGCTMCGYFNDSLWKNLNHEDILLQFEKAMEKYNGEKIVKIFNSGSFFDDKEIKSKTRISILNDLIKKVDKISVESRPEYITNEKLEEIYDIITPKNFEIGVGLETANDLIREKSINKGFKFSQYQEAANKIKKYGFKIKTYLLLKPPFLTEEEAIFDNIETIKKVRSITDIVSLNPTNIQRNTYVEYLWKRNQYTPPWLWSVMQVLIKSKRIMGKKRIKCDIVGGGSYRGPHNCGKCDSEIISNISNFSINQNIELLGNNKCECYERWLDQIDIEKFCFGSQINMHRRLI
jgi:radical SAM enzyme (TIGR01210 family)